MSVTNVTNEAAMRELFRETEQLIFDEAKEIISNLVILGGKDLATWVIENSDFALCEYLPSETIFSRKAYRKSLSVIVRGRATVRKVHGGKYARRQQHRLR